ncbi:MAG: alpha/beta fold hydrolase [Gemmatimonadaceae bacterium]
MDLFFRDQGSGEPALVFLHYFAGSSRAWNAVIDRMQSTHRCVAPDLRGFGNSSAPESGYAVCNYADDVEELVRSLGLESYILVGHSMGGKFAMAMAARRPLNLRALVLVDPSPPTPEPMSRSDREHLLASHGDRGAMVKLIQKITVRPLSEAVFETAVDDNLRSSRAAWCAWLEHGSREDISGRIPNVCVPALVIRGAEDPVMQHDMLEREVVGRIKDARMVQIPDVGHLSPMEAPEAVAALIRGVAQSATWELT